LKQPFELTLSGFRLLAEAFAAESFADRADALFDLKQALAAETLERFAQQIAQPANVRPQRSVFRLIGAWHLYGVAFGCVTPGQSSVLNGVAGSPSLLYRLQVGYFTHA
jgi:hypothetical protein